jgi:hypothetical protein
MEIFHLCEVELIVDIDIPFGVKAKICLPNSLNLIPGILELTDFGNTGKGPSIEFKLEPLAKKKLAFKLNGRAKILGLTGQLFAEVNWPLNVQIKLGLDCKMFEALHFRNDFTLSLGPQIPFILRNEMDL